MKHRIPNTSRTFRLGAVIQFVYSRSSSGVIWYVLINKGSTAILLSIYLSVIKTQYYQKAALPSRTLAPERGRFSGHTSLARSAHPPGGFLFHRTNFPVKKNLTAAKIQVLCGCEAFVLNSMVFVQCSTRTCLKIHSCHRHALVSRTNNM